ncbi:DUF6182 family protein [Bradyrhizobium sp. Leaf401]|uniref:DUF6182 family protein n=1 Tax=Bradyrhizobium sp. Leaf401 TaxID=2876564 RepID=UPI001E56784C|nr:DUF6182 family protein [Bradyrhizobium sp. Leaf401]
MANEFQKRLSASGIIELGHADDVKHLAKEIANSATALVVLRDFNPKAFGESCLKFACGLDLNIKREWFRNFTRTLFLVGNPLKLRYRFRFDQISDDGSIGWISSSVPSSSPLPRLLKSFHVDPSPVPSLELDLDVPGETGQRKTWLVYLDTAELNVSQCLVHLNHILAESVITGLFRAGDRICVRPVMGLVECSTRFVSMRVHFDVRDRNRLRGYAGVAQEPDGQMNIGWRVDQHDT